MSPLFVTDAAPPLMTIPPSPLTLTPLVPSPRIVPELSRLSCGPVERTPLFAPWMVVPEGLLTGVESVLSKP